MKQLIGRRIVILPERECAESSLTNPWNLILALLLMVRSCFKTLNSFPARTSYGHARWESGWISLGGAHLPLDDMCQAGWLFRISCWRRAMPQILRMRRKARHVYFLLHCLDLLYRMRVRLPTPKLTVSSIVTKTTRM
jgi:hypothetical protein